jgi:predicted O-methyltransferase YrrM
MEEKDLKILDSILNRKPYYENFPVEKYKYYLRPGSMPVPDILTNLVNQINPSLIIEIGSFLGYSAVIMGKAAQSLGKDFRIICVDMWLSGDDYGWVERDTEPPEECSWQVNGYPTIYHQFVKNVIENKLEKNIIPLVKTSKLGSLILRNKIKNKVKVEADLIYIDASHEDIDVYYDCKEYWPLVKTGGVMFGDDWTWAGVRSAVLTFVEENKLEEQFKIHPNGVHWFIKKQL